MVILHRRIILPFGRFDVDITTGFILFRKKRSRALESLVLEQHLDQTRSRVLLVLVLLVLRQQHPGLDVHQLRRHCDEVTGNVQIHVLGLVQNRHVLLKDFRDGDIVNAHLVFGNQVQQQVERPVKVV